VSFFEIFGVKAFCEKTRKEGRRARKKTRIHKRDYEKRYIYA
jgi:hypothetical protein